MKRGIKNWITGALISAMFLPGCNNGERKLTYLGGSTEMSYYKDKATQIAYPDVENANPDEVVQTLAPRRLRNALMKDQVQDIRLAEAMHIALTNNKIIRDRGQFLSTSSAIVSNPNVAPSVFDPAIQESGVLFGQRGVEAALSDFDAQFTTNMLWGRSEQVQNNLFFGGGLPPGTTLAEESAAFTSRLQKTNSTGGTFGVSHVWNYTLNNVPSRLFGSSYAGFIRADYRQPLWAGSGTEFTRIAGPIGSNLFGVSGVAQGVVIARINNDISLADFEASVRNLTRDVEDSYWDLLLTYRTYHSEVVARDSALQTWKKVKSNADLGRPGGGAADEAQARDNYYEARGRAENALADIYSSEGRFRRLLGLPVNDGRILRPVDEPLVAEFLPDWYVSLTEALTRRLELRKQKWNIKSLELQLTAAQSLTRPRFDFVSAYQVNGFGDKLISRSDDDGVTSAGYHSAYGALTAGDQTGWNLGFEFSMPIGFRQAHSQVRNLELRLTKARTGLSTLELEISHELASAFQGLDRAYVAAQTNFNRRAAADKRVRAYEALYDRDPSALDLLLRAQISLAQADIAYHRSIIDYNKAVTDVRFRKGTLLEENNVHLAESQWSTPAYQEAYRRAWARTHAFDNPTLKTKPGEFETNHGGTVRLMNAGAGMVPTPGVEVLPQETPTVPPAPAVEQQGHGFLPLNPPTVNSPPAVQGVTFQGEQQPLFSPQTFHP